MKKIVPYYEQLNNQILNFKKIMFDLFDVSTIEEFHNDPFSDVVFIGPSFYWGPTNPNQNRIQMQLKNSFQNLSSQIDLIFLNASSEVKNRIKNTNNFMWDWIEKKSNWEIPKTIEEAKLVFDRKIEIYNDLILEHFKKDCSNIIVIPDTNSLINKSDFLKYKELVGESNISILLIPTVLKELDELKIKHRNNDFREKIKSIIRLIKNYRSKGSLLIGINISDSIKLKMVAAEPKFDSTFNWLDSTNSDDRIVASTFEIQRENPLNTVVCITSDINLQNKLEMVNIPYIDW